MPRWKLIGHLTAAATLLVASGMVHATTIGLTYLNNLGNPTGSITGYNSVRAGEFNFAINSIDGDAPAWGATLDAFCIDISTALQNTATYTLHEGLGSLSSNTQQNRVDRLFTSYYELSTTSAHNSAAFQLALWEILNESHSSLNLSSGSFSSGAFDGARTIANNWLANLGTLTGGYEYYILRADNSQDLVTVRQVNVPEPTVLLLMGTGLLILALAQRRRIGIKPSAA